MYLCIPWRDSNPGLLSLRWMRCPLRHSAWENFLKNTFLDHFNKFKASSRGEASNRVYKSEEKIQL
jgi:hypothetical protein